MRHSQIAGLEGLQIWRLPACIVPWNNQSRTAVKGWYPKCGVWRCLTILPLTKSASYITKQRKYVVLFCDAAWTRRPIPTLEKCTVSIFRTENRMFIRSFCMYVEDHTLSHLRTKSSSSLPWEPQITHIHIIWHGVRSLSCGILRTYLEISFLLFLLWFQGNGMYGDTVEEKRWRNYFDIIMNPLFSCWTWTY
jgi:hypothetical protein